MPNRNRHKPTENPQDFFATVAQAAPKNRILAMHSGGKTVEIQQTVKLRVKPVAVGIPLDEVLFAKFFSNYQGLTIMPWDDLLGTTSTYLPEARNAIHNMFLDNSPAEYLFMLDSDVLPQPNIIDRLLEHHLPMVGGWYKKKNTQQPVVYDFKGFDAKGVGEWKIREVPGTGLEKVDAAGAGCWLMSKSAAEALGHSPYDMLRGGEDLDLCLKAHDKGVDTWIDWNLPCAHAGVMYV